MGYGLTLEMRRFLEALAEFDGPIQSPRLSVPAGGAQCYARRKCRDHGFAARVKAEGRTRWQITALGRQALAPALPRHPVVGQFEFRRSGRG